MYSEVYGLSEGPGPLEGMLPAEVVVLVPPPGVDVWETGRVVVVGVAAPVRAFSRGIISIQISVFTRQALRVVV